MMTQKDQSTTFSLNDELSGVLLEAVEQVNVKPVPDDVVQRVLRRAKDLDCPKSDRATRRLQLFTAKLQSFTAAKKVVAASIGLSTAVGLILLILVWNSAERAAAVERMLKAVGEVTSFSFELSDTTTFSAEWMRKWKPNDRIETPSLGKDHPSTLQRNDTTYWVAPGYLSGESKSVRFEGDEAPGEHERTVSHIREIAHPKRHGLFVNHLNQTYCRMQYQGVPLVKFPEYSPINWLEKIRTESGKVVRDLGRKKIDGRSARGYVFNLSYDDKVRELEVWVSAETDLPLECVFEGTDEGRHTLLRITNCRWGIDVDPDLFEPTPPAGYVDATPPTEKEDFVQIANALRLYARLNGGFYPRDTEFSTDEVLNEMRKLAGFTGPATPEWTQRTEFSHIQQATTGLNWIAKILLNKSSHNAGYAGRSVGPHNSDKVLLWWKTMDLTENRRVFYGDLRTEIVGHDKWGELVSAGLASF